MNSDSIRAWIASRFWLIRRESLTLLASGSADLKGYADQYRSLQAKRFDRKFKADWDSGSEEDEEPSGPKVIHSDDWIDSYWFRGAVVDENGIATVPIHGTSYHRDTAYSWVMSAAYGGFITEKMIPILNKVAAHEDVKGIVLSIDSPGGEASGCGEFSRSIARIGKNKPVVAHVDQLMCSAQYWSGSSARHIMGDPASLTGSIGTVLTIYDDRELMAKLGIKEHEFVSKQSPHKRPDPATTAGGQRYQKLVDDLAHEFIQGVAANRDRSVARVEDDFGRGDVLIASEAKHVGLIDSIGTPADAVAAALDYVQSTASAPGQPSLAARSRQTQTQRGHANGQANAQASPYRIVLPVRRGR